MSHAGSDPYLVDPDQLVKEGYLTKKEVEAVSWGDDPEKVDFAGMVDQISVSDPDLTDGKSIIVYTRIWNETKKKYDTNLRFCNPIIISDRLLSRSKTKRKHYINAKLR